MSRQSKDRLIRGIETAIEVLGMLLVLIPIIKKQVTKKKGKTK